jgi:hypothetical protein
VGEVVTDKEAMPRPTSPSADANEQHRQVFELQQQKGEHELALAREQTAQIRVRYVVGAAVVAIIGALGVGYKAYVEHLGTQQKLGLEQIALQAKNNAETNAQAAERSRVAMTVMVEVVNADAEGRLPRLRYLAKGEDSSLKRWAQEEIAETKALIARKTAAEEAVREAQTKLNTAKAKAGTRKSGGSTTSVAETTAQLADAESALSKAEVAAQAVRAQAVASPSTGRVKPCVSGRRASLVTTGQVSGPVLAQVEQLCQRAPKVGGIASGGGREAWLAGTLPVDGREQEYWCSCIVD